MLDFKFNHNSGNASIHLLFLKSFCDTIGNGSDIKNNIIMCSKQSIDENVLNKWKGRMYLAASLPSEKLN